MEPLRPQASPSAQVNWFAQHAVGLGTLVLGAIAFVVIAVSQDKLWSVPDWRLSVPFFVGTLVGAVVSLARKEGLPILPLGGLGLAAVAMAMGWFLIMAAIVAVIAILILILSMVM